MTEEKKEMPWDFWNHNINPILGYEYSTRDVLDYKQQKRNKYEYPPEQPVHHHSSDRRNQPADQVQGPVG